MNLNQSTSARLNAAALVAAIRRTALRDGRGKLGVQAVRHGTPTYFGMAEAMMSRNLIPDINAPIAQLPVSLVPA